MDPEAYCEGRGGSNVGRRERRARRPQRVGRGIGAAQERVRQPARRREREAGRETGEAAGHGQWAATELPDDGQAVERQLGSLLAGRRGREVEREARREVPEEPRRVEG